MACSGVAAGSGVELGPGWERGGVILLATHSLWFDSDRLDKALSAIFHTDRVRLGWIGLA